MKFLYENFLQFYLLALTSIIQHLNKYWSLTLILLLLNIRTPIILSK
ncbi:hypothetical protein [Spiroplasma endosymbiont of Nomada rufipes]